MIAITGIGAVSALGADRETVWRHVCEGSPSMGAIRAFGPEEFGLSSCVVAETADSIFEEARDRISSVVPDAKKLGRFSILSLAAAREAIEHAGLSRNNSALHALPPNARSAIILGTSFAGIGEFERSVLLVHEGRKPRFADNFGMRTSIVIQRMARAFGVGGPSFGIDSACSSGASAILQAARLIRSREIDWCLAGGVESELTPTRLRMTQSLGLVSKRFRDEPCRSSRPFDIERDGFVPGDGAAFLLLESEDHARERGAAVFARIAGFCERVYVGHPTGLSRSFAREVMTDAQSDANLSPGAIGWINAHAASTPQGDAAEASAIADMAGDLRIPVSAPKSVTGHLMAASGALETAISALSLRDQIIPGTINLDAQDSACPVFVTRSTTAASFKAAQTNSFGFGGSCSSIVLIA